LGKVLLSHQSQQQSQTMCNEAAVQLFSNSFNNPDKAMIKQILPYFGGAEGESCHIAGVEAQMCNIFFTPTMH
jgi:hypothetical protein